MTAVVELHCERRGARTVVARAHQVGLARTSRLPGRNGTAHVMLATLGPGVLRGDRFETRGRLGPDAELLVTGQMATPVFPGAPATLATHWEVADGAMLCLVGQPLVPLAGSVLETVLRLDVAARGRAVAAETLVARSGAAVRGRVFGRLDGAVVLRDVLELRADTPLAEAVGTVYAVTADAALRTRFTADAWALVDALADVRGGVGGTDGAVVVRCTGSAFAVQRATARIAARLSGLSPAGEQP